MNGEKSLVTLEGLAPLVGLRIRTARAEKDLSQKELVGERFSKSYISSIERGKITPSLKALEYIAKRLEVSVSYLLTGVHTDQTAENQAQEAEEESEIPARWDLVLLEARILREQAKYEPAKNLLTTKVRVRQLNIEQLKQYYWVLAQLYLDLNDNINALVQIENAQSLAEKTGDAEVLAQVRRLTGIVYLQQGKSILAIEQLRLALQAIENNTIKDFHFKLNVYSYLGILQSRLGDHKEAIGMFREALKLAEEMAEPQKLANLNWNLSQSYRDTQNYVLAKVHATKALSLYETVAEKIDLAQLRVGFGMVQLANHQYEEAEQQFLLALNLAVTAEALTIANMHLSDLYLEQEKIGAAIRYSDEMLKTVEQSSPLTAGQALSSRAGLLMAQGKPTEATLFFENALALIEPSEAKATLSKIYFRYAGLLKANGDNAKAAEMFERAYRFLK
jgi:HTH-type transcriptional regulator, quorum sensing regulator NprR